MQNICSQSDSLDFELIISPILLWLSYFLCSAFQCFLTIAVYIKVLSSL
jgi:hypothetical protein